MNKFNIGFKNANQTFRALVKLQLKENLKKSKLIKLKPYFLFSNIFDRYPFSSSINSLDTLFAIGKKNNVIDENLYNSLDFSHKIAFHFGRLRSGSFFFNISFLLTCINNFLFWGVKFCISFLDFLIINVYSFFYILIGINKKKKNKFFDYKKQNINIYTFQLWKSKGYMSPKYYYPNFCSNSQDFYFATDFYQFKMISSALINFPKSKNLLIYLDLISINDLFEAVFLLLETFCFDLFGDYKKGLGSIFNSLSKLNTINRRFLSILNYKSSLKIFNFLHPNKVFVWTENQLHSKAFSIGLYQSKRDSYDTQIVSYIGSPFSVKYHSHLIPERLEIDSGVWGDRVLMFQDNNSLNEMKSTINDIFNINDFHLKISSDNLKRFDKNNVVLQKINIQTTRNITFFTHGTPKEFYVVLAVFFKSNYQLTNNLGKDKLYIRVHPALDVKNLELNINKLQNNLDISLPEIKFIFKNQEDISESISKTNYCLFGESSYINLAFSMNKKVISVRTSFLFNPPIQKLYSKNKNLIKLN